jgi:hypothetical protein
MDVDVVIFKIKLIDFRYPIASILGWLDMEID